MNREMLELVHAQTDVFVRTLSREHDAGQHEPGQYTTCPKCAASMIRQAA